MERRRWRRLPTDFEPPPLADCIQNRRARFTSRNGPGGGRGWQHTAPVISTGIRPTTAQSLLSSDGLNMPRRRDTELFDLATVEPF